MVKAVFKKRGSSPRLLWLIDALTPTSENDHADQDHRNNRHDAKGFGGQQPGQNQIGHQAHPLR